MIEAIFLASKFGVAGWVKFGPYDYDHAVLVRFKLTGMSILSTAKVVPFLI